MRGLRATPFACAVILAACGTTTPSPSPQLAVSPASRSSAMPGGSAADYVLTTATLPSGAQAWTQILDEPLNGDANTDQRAWKNGNDTQRVEIDVLLDSSTTAAEQDYSTWSSQSTNTIASTAARPACPSTLDVGSCNEVIGTTSAGANEGLLAWQEGRVLVAVVYAVSTGSLSRSYLEALATAENVQISSLIGT